MDVTYEGTKREVATEQGVLRYHEAGDGPPLLLLHGSGIGVSGWRNFRRNLGVFAEHFHCYVLEFPGFGISDPVAGHPVLTAVDSVIRFMDAVGIDSAPMIGNSMGGVVAVNVAVKHPARVAKVIAIGGVGTGIFSITPSEGTRLLQEFADDPSREKLVRWLNCMAYDRSIITEELIEERWQTANQPDSHAVLKAMYGSEAFAMQQKFLANSDIPPYWSMLHKVKCPVLLTWGLEDRQCPPDMAMMPLRLIPHAELHTFPKCGHWVMVEAKEAFERVSLEFLQRKSA
ncbi:alpha/beta fold hydrolase [Nocardia huaxiensis]|uniref:Alpha/beta fold hydrolase n=1 Tax=Nocardia huaxiensis TaxID=2755382 RepID=A0A7D6ZE79_9NOCA|nr:alpha/beta hydrolase [Nocardia huaxiensis]QLY27980.1 alpha/beta fold hydrolase [Nocardia huaxiensis]UFS98617.1 alpha/beta fold hydrolase [Nocardia huaxiensis]